jgi:hypothetical protein
MERPGRLTQLFVSQRLWAWLASHLHGPGGSEELDRVLNDPRWFVAELNIDGPDYLEAGLRCGALLQLRHAITSCCMSDERPAAPRSRASRV